MGEATAPSFSESNPYDEQLAAAKIRRQYETNAELSTDSDALFQQRAVAEWFEAQKPERGNTYRVARELLAEAPDPGYERTRVLLICHSVREVINRLPTAVMLGRGSLDRSAVANHRDSSELVRSLPKLRVEYPEMDLSQEVENVPVPRDLALAFNCLIDTSVNEDQRRLSDLAAFLTTMPIASIPPCVSGAA